jgi:hypothetical protein
MIGRRRKEGRKEEGKKEREEERKERSFVSLINS